MLASCGKSFGLMQVSYDVLAEVGIGLDFWQARARLYWPHLCRTWADGPYYGQWGSWVKLRAALRDHGDRCATHWAFHTSERCPHLCQWCPRGRCFQYDAAAWEHQ